jgi:hypothetical protein
MQAKSSLIIPFIAGAAAQLDRMDQESIIQLKLTSYGVIVVAVEFSSGSPAASPMPAKIVRNPS